MYMTLIINDQAERFDGETMTVEELLALKNIKKDGTAVAINGKLCMKDKWSITILSDRDDVTIISAAYGG
ncbi:MAG: sulfur carrier protein ThiS [Muribaculaceae bacterium]|nr:sulfur carrier protein ThiS [Muribaculaceae bacterium]